MNNITKLDFNRFSAAFDKYVVVAGSTVFRDDIKRGKHSEKRVNQLVKRSRKMNGHRE